MKCEIRWITAWLSGIWRINRGLGTEFRTETIKNFSIYFEKVTISDRWWEE